MKTAFVTGANGHIASYLVENLLQKNYIVHGLIRRSSNINTQRIDHLYNDDKIYNKRLFLHYGDLADMGNLNLLLYKIKPDEIYNLAAQSHVQVSFDLALYTADIVGLGTLRLLESIRQNNLNTKFLQMSSSEMFGGLLGTQPQSETTPFHPRSPYGVSKLFSYYISINYRESFDMFVSNSITFNTESQKRGETFVTKKITKAVANIVNGKQDCLVLGNIEAKRDWTFSGDIVEGLWLILQQDKPDDFVLGSGETHSVKEFVELAFNEVGIKIVWDGEGINEKGIDSKTNKVLVKVDPKYFRPAEVDILHANPSKAKQILGWQPKTSFQELVSMMVEHDLKLAGDK